MGKTITIPLEEGEFWWGGHVTLGLSMPFDASSDVSQTLCGRNLCNQATPVFVSSHGRWVWSDTPFAYSFGKDGFQIVGGEPELGIADDKTLRGAYLDISSKKFPPSGKIPDPILFKAPQWNTWIELTYNQNQADIIAYADSLLANGFPPCAIMIDDTWQAGYGVWQFDPRRFPDPKAMCDYLHSKGFKIMLWVVPYVSPDTPEYRDVYARKGLLMDAADPKGRRPFLMEWWNGYSACVDFSSEGGMAWFSEQLDRLQRDYGVDGFKFDAGDSIAYADYGSFIAATPEGSTPEGQSMLYGKIGLRYPFNEFRAMWKMGNQPLGERLCDKNHSWVAVQQCVADIVVEGILGYQFCCPDMIGGGNYVEFGPDKELDKALIVRYAQASALMPMMQFSLNPWRVMSAETDAQYLDAIKKAVAIRAEYTDKIFELANRAATTGEPIISNMEYAFPGQGLAQVRDQFVLGSDLIVAPVITKENARTVRLPKGLWIGDDGVAVQGPATIELNDIPIDRLPHWRAG